MVTDSRLASLFTPYTRNICRIRKYLDCNSTEKLVYAFVSSRLESNNNIFHGLPKSELSKLQRIQSAAARLKGIFSDSNNIFFMAQIRRYKQKKRIFKI